MGGALILGRCRAFDLFASVDAHLWSKLIKESNKNIFGTHHFGFYDLLYAPLLHVPETEQVVYPEFTIVHERIANVDQWREF